MANATLTMNVDELADAIAAKVSKVDPSEHEAVTAERDELRRELGRIGQEAWPARFYDEHGAGFAGARAFLDHYREERRAAEVVAEKLESVTDERDELRGDLRTACDERDEFRRQLDEAQAKLSGAGVLAKDAVMVHEGTDPYGVLSAGEVVTVVHGKVDEDGDVRVAREGQRGDWEYARVSNLKPRKRTYKAGDPEPEDKTVTLTGEDSEGRKVTLKYGRHSRLQVGGGRLAWWDVSTALPTYSAKGFQFWAEKFGPLTEV